MSSEVPKSLLKILSLDAGGAAGLLNARLLQRISYSVPDFLKEVDLIAGSSAGAINALILAQHADPADGVEACVRLWEEPKLMSNTPWNTLLATFGLSPFISADNYRSILSRYIDDQLTLGHSRMKKNVLITTFDLAASQGKDRNWEPRLFTSWGDPNQSALDMAIRAGAAPIMQAVEQGYIDGGMFNASPTMSALTELAPLIGKDEEALKKKHYSTPLSLKTIKDFYDRLATPLKETATSFESIEQWFKSDASQEGILVLSVGTGSKKQFIDVSRTEPTNWGYLQWLIPSRLNNFTALASLLLNAQEAIADDNLKNLDLLWPRLKGYHRLNPSLKYPVLLYSVAPLVAPFLREFMTTQLEADVNKQETRAKVQETIDWLYDKGWSKKIKENV
ncbi:MAG: patatin-like phospholipase family protein [Gammaproteobacteria bacterium]|nr:patatin-like phospholipase family protein [Gammaproteobacteria bacterium]